MATGQDAEFLVFEERLSDSPLIERVWRSRSERAGRLHSVAQGNCELAVTRLRGATTLTLRGPETRVTTADCPADGEWLGIRLRLGASIVGYPAGRLRDRQDVTLPSVDARSFRLHGTDWEYPSFENAETFVARLLRSGLVAIDPAVEDALHGGGRAQSRRTAQRHFLKLTGMTRRTFRQIERARHATNLLRRGVPVLDVVHDAGFFDQAHLTHSLRRLTGQTPAGTARKEVQLSFLYNTALDR